MQSSRLSRRAFLASTAIAAAGSALAACQPKVVEVTKVVEKVVKEEVIVAGTPQIVEKVVKETVVVEPTAAAKAQVTLVHMVFGGYAYQWPMYEMIAVAYQERNPHIKIEYIYVPRDQYTQKLKTMEAAGDPPDVNIPLGGVANSFRGVDYSFWLDLAPYVERDNYDLGDFYEGSLAAVRHPFTKALEGIPSQVFVGVIAYNKDLFAEAGVPEPPHNWDDQSWTHEKLREVAIQLTKDKNGRHPGEPGFDPNAIEQYGIYDAQWPQLWGWVFGGEALRSDPEDRRKVRVAEPAFVEGLQFWQDMVYKDSVIIKPYELQAFQGTATTPFHTGKVGMWHCANMNIEALSAIKAFAWDVAAEPYGPFESRQHSVQYLDNGWMAAAGKHKDEAWQWLSYLTSPGMAERFSVDLRQCLPARISVVDKYAERMAATIPTLDGKVISAALVRSQYLEYWAPPTEWSEIWNQYADKFRAGEATAAEAMNEVAPLIQENWDEYYSRFKL